MNRQSEPSTGAKDSYVADVLQRLARARTNLVLAQRAVERPPAVDRAPSAVDLVEAARVDLLWATASAIVAPDSERSRRRLTEARTLLAELLERVGFESYAAFADVHPPTDLDADPRVADAREEFEFAAAEWESVQQRMLEPDESVIDLTGD